MDHENDVFDENPASCYDVNPSIFPVQHRFLSKNMVPQSISSTNFVRNTFRSEGGRGAKALRIS